MSVRGIRQPSPPGTVLGNVGSNVAQPSPISFASLVQQLVANGPPGSFLQNLTAAMDLQFGKSQGDILYRDAAAWKVLAPGTAGQGLITGGAGANPSWANMGIKAVLKGTISITAGNFANTATIAAATGKTELRHLGNIGPGTMIDTEIYIEDTNATTITATRAGNTGTAIVSWERTEYN